MDSQQLQTLVRAAGEGVVDCCLGIEQGEVVLVHTACKVNVLGIEEEALVKESRLLYRRHSEKHKAS